MQTNVTKMQKKRKIQEDKRTKDKTTRKARQARRNEKRSFDDEES